MADIVTPEKRSEIMARILGKNTEPELIVRKLVHRMGYRYRVHRNDLPGTPDIVFSGRKKAIFVHGCFWHQHKDSHCTRTHTPTSNVEYWQPKLERNRNRDVIQQSQLSEMGWDILVVWECEVQNENDLPIRIENFLGRVAANA